MVRLFISGISILKRKEVAVTWIQVLEAVLIKIE